MYPLWSAKRRFSWQPLVPMYLHLINLFYTQNLTIHMNSFDVDDQVVGSLQKYYLLISPPQ